MLLTTENVREFIESVLPGGCRIERSTIFRGDIAIAGIDVDQSGLYINSMYFRYGDIPQKRIDGLRRWLSL
jgi:hypothetical protein